MADTKPKSEAAAKEPNSQPKPAAVKEPSAQPKPAAVKEPSVAVTKEKPVAAAAPDNTNKKSTDTPTKGNGNTKAGTEGGKAKAGSGGNNNNHGVKNQPSSSSSGDQKTSYKERKKQKEQERYQRKIQNRPENKGTNKTNSQQKQGTPSKQNNNTTTNGKSAESSSSASPTLSVTIQGDGRTVTEGKEKTVVESKGKSVIEAPETKQGGEERTEEERQLEEHQIFRLAKKSLRFPKAKFYCRLCNYHLDTVDLAFKHVEEARHSKLEKTKKDQEFLRTLPPASDAHREALTNLLTTIVNKHKMTKEDMKQRADIVPRIEKVLQKELPKCQVRLYGSSVSGFGFKDSNVNLDINMAPDVSPATILLGADKAMHKHSADVFKDVVTDFDGKFPCINFVDKKSGLTCQVGTNSQFAVDTSKLLHEYYSLDPRVPVLALGLRHWARLCGVDQQADGSIPAYAFVIMVIHFLQQCDPPVVPVLQEKEKLEKVNGKTVGELWLDLLKFYVVEMPIEEWVITIRNRKPISRQDMKIPNKRLAVEDPFALNKKNITKSLTTSVVFQFIMERLREALKYFGLPQYTPGKEPTPSNCYSFFVHKKSGDNAVTGEGTKSNSTGVDGLANNLSEKLVIEHTDTHRTNNSTDAKKSAPTAKTAAAKTTKNKTVEKTDKKQTVEGGKADENSVGRAPSVTDFNFLFDQELLTAGEKVPLICSGCGIEGHVEKDCQDEALIDLIPLPPMPPNFMHKIDMLCVNITEDMQTRRWDMEMRENIVWDLQAHIRRNGYGDSCLRLFGSSMNGFGFRQSDLDICMTFKAATNPKSLNFPEIVEKLAKILKKNRDLYAITPIPTAKVPIVKFVHRPSRLEGDISLYNMLAQVNTRMLYCYSSIDPRVRQLAYSMKLYAKICDIGDASKGSLSSYAYTLMTLFFLQQRKPPVIPVLQELYNTKNKPEAIMEGCNAWFFEDMRNLPRVWKDHGKNRESVGQLWLGMLRFYTEEFDFKKHVIAIRQMKPLTRFEKMWTAPSRGFAIEDPFDLDHNLGGGVSRKMATYMMQVFRKTRERFGLPRRIPAYTDDFDYFFDVEFLSDGKAPPNDRGCRVCGKIGHFVKDCPRRRPKGSESNDKRKGSDSNDKRKEDGKGTPSKQQQESSPKKSAQKESSSPQKPSSPQKSAPSNKDTPKKEAPEKEILKRGDTAPSNKPPSTTPVSTTTTTTPGARPATLTPTTKPLVASTTNTTSTVVSGATSNGGAGAEHPVQQPRTGKQRTNSIGDTWEHHKQTGKKTSKKKKKNKSESEGDPPQSDSPAPVATTSQQAKPGGTPASTQKPQSAPAQKTTSTSQVASTQKPGSANPPTTTTAGNKPATLTGGNNNKAGNQKTPQILQNKNPQHQKLQQQQQQQKAALSAAATAAAVAAATQQQQVNAEQQIQLPQRYQQAQPQRGMPQNATQKTPGFPNNQNFSPQQRVLQQQQLQQQQKVPQQILQKTNQKQQPTPKNAQHKNQKNNQKTPGGQQKTPAAAVQKAAAGDPAAAPAFAQPPPAQKHVPFSKKRLPKGPNLSLEQQKESQKALVQQMTQGLMQMLKDDKEQRRALKQADANQPRAPMHQPPPPRSQQQQQHQVGSQGDKGSSAAGDYRGQQATSQTESGGANTHQTQGFQQYPMQPNQRQHQHPFQPNTSPNKTNSAPGPARLQSSLPLSPHADAFTQQRTPGTDLGLMSHQYPATTQEGTTPQQKSPSSVLGRSPPKFTSQQLSPGSTQYVPSSDHAAAPPVSLFQPRYSSMQQQHHKHDPASVYSNQMGVFHHQQPHLAGTQSPVEISHFHVQRDVTQQDQDQLPAFGSVPSKNAVNVERSPPGFAGGVGSHHQQAPTAEQQQAMHIMGYQMEHLAAFGGQSPAAQQVDATNAKSTRDFQSSLMFPHQGREEVSPFTVVGNQQQLPIGIGGLRRFNAEAQSFERQPGQPQPASSQMGINPAKFPAGGGFDISPWFSSPTSQAQMRFPTSNNPQHMTQFGNLNTSPGTPPFMNYSAGPGNPYAMPPSPPSAQLHQASPVFGTGVSPSPPNTQLFQQQGNPFGSPAGVIGSPAGGVPYTSAPAASMHMLTNDSGLGLGYAAGSNESSGVPGNQGSVGDRLYREAVSLATTSSTYPAFPGGTASNAAIPTHINIHPKPAVLPYATPGYAQHQQLASLYSSGEGQQQQLVHGGEVEGQSVVGQSPR